MKTLYKFHWDCGRQGKLESLFIADSSDVKDAIGQEVYFGEVLGKYSEVYGELEEKDFTEISTNPDLIATLEALHPHFNYQAHLDTMTLSGYNPLYYISCMKCEETMIDCCC